MWTHGDTERSAGVPDTGRFVEDVALAAGK